MDIILGFSYLSLDKPLVTVFYSGKGIRDKVQSIKGY